MNPLENTPPPVEPTPERRQVRYMTPDIVSADLQRRTAIVILTIVVGLVLGIVSLGLAGEKGSTGWLTVASMGAVLGTFVVISYNQRRVTDLIGWTIVGFLMVCWIAVGTPTVAEGQSGGGSKSLLISQAGLLLLLLLWGIEIFLRQRVDLVKTPINRPIAFYLFFCVLATAIAIVFPNAAVLAYSPKIVVQVNILENVMRFLALGGLLMIGNKLRGKTLRFAALAVLLPGVATFSGILSFIPASPYLAFPQVIAMALLVAFAISPVEGVKTWVRVLAGVVALAIFGNYFIKGAEWVSGWGSGIVALAIIFFHHNRKLLYAGIALVFLLICTNPMYYYNKIYASNFYGSGKTHDRARVGHMGTFENDRTRMIMASFRYAEEFPLGIGLGNYRSYNHYFGQVNVWNTTVFTSAHGTYSQALTETGWPGLLSLLAIIYSSCRLMRQYYFRLPERSWARAFALGSYGGCFGIFVAALIGDYLFPAYHNGGLGSFGSCAYTWFAIGVVIAIGREYNISMDSPIPARLEAGGRAA